MKVGGYKRRYMNTVYLDCMRNITFIYYFDKVYRYDSVNDSIVV